MAISLFRMALRISNQEAPAPTKRGTVILCKVKLCNALLGMLLVCIRSYLESVMRNKCLILCTYHLDTLYIREQGYEDPWLSSAAKRGSEQKEIWERRA